MFISPFSPIFFNDSKSDGIESRYMQVFASSDRILLEVITPGLLLLNAGITVKGITDKGQSIEFSPAMRRWGMADGSQLYFYEITGLNDGCYQISLEESNLNSHWFRVTSNSTELADTVLIQYSNIDNRRRKDAVFMIDGVRHFFDFRVHGGFKDSGWVFGVDNEQFITPDGDPIELYALENVQKRLTIGGQIGVPIWFGELLNRLLTCNYVYIDGVRYARKDSSVPEVTAAMEGLDSFIFTQNLQQVSNLDPHIEEVNGLTLRRTDASQFRSLTTNSLLIPSTQRII